MSPKLSDDDVRAIRASSETGAALSARFGVAQSTISKIKRRLARAEVEDLPMSDEPAMEGGEIEPSPPEQTAPEAEGLPAGYVNVECTVPNVHLGGDQRLLMGEIGAVPQEIADLLVEKDMAKVV